jgi:hypothetical protein
VLVADQRHIRLVVDQRELRTQNSVTGNRVANTMSTVLRRVVLQISIGPNGEAAQSVPAYAAAKHLGNWGEAAHPRTVSGPAGVGAVR